MKKNKSKRKVTGNSRPRPPPIEVPPIGGGVSVVVPPLSALPSNGVGVGAGAGAGGMRRSSMPYSLSIGGGNMSHNMNMNVGGASTGTASTASGNFPPPSLLPQSSPHRQNPNHHHHHSTAALSSMNSPLGLSTSTRFDPSRLHGHGLGHHPPNSNHPNHLHVQHPSPSSSQLLQSSPLTSNSANDGSHTIAGLHHHRRPHSRQLQHQHQHHAHQQHQPIMASPPGTRAPSREMPNNHGHNPTSVQQQQQQRRSSSYTPSNAVNPYQSPSPSIQQQRHHHHRPSIMIMAGNSGSMNHQGQQSHQRQGSSGGDSTANIVALGGSPHSIGYNPNAMKIGMNANVSPSSSSGVSFHATGRGGQQGGVNTAAPGVNISTKGIPPGSGVVGAPVGVSRPSSSASSSPNNTLRSPRHQQQNQHFIQMHQHQQQEQRRHSAPSMNFSASHQHFVPSPQRPSSQHQQQQILHPSQIQQQIQQQLKESPLSRHSSQQHKQQTVMMTSPPKLPRQVMNRASSSSSSRDQAMRSSSDASIGSNGVKKQNSSTAVAGSHLNPSHHHHLPHLSQQQPHQQQQLTQQQSLQKTLYMQNMRKQQQQPKQQNQMDFYGASPTAPGGGGNNSNNFGLGGLGPPAPAPNSINSNHGMTPMNMQQHFSSEQQSQQQHQQNQQQQHSHQNRSIMSSSPSSFLSAAASPIQYKKGFTHLQNQQQEHSGLSSSPSSSSRLLSMNPNASINVRNNNVTISSTDAVNSNIAMMQKQVLQQQQLQQQSQSSGSNPTDSKKRKRPNSTSNAAKITKATPSSSSNYLIGTNKILHAKDAVPLIQSLPWDEQLIYVLRHIMSDDCSNLQQQQNNTHNNKGTCSNGTNGFYSTLSIVNGYKDEMMSSKKNKKKKKKPTVTGDDYKRQNERGLSDGTASGPSKKKQKKKKKGSSSSDNDVSGNDLDQNFCTIQSHSIDEKEVADGLKLLKSNPDVARNMMVELGLGLTFCHTMSMTIESILKTIDNPSKSTGNTNCISGIGGGVEAGKKKQSNAISMTQFHSPSNDALLAGSPVGSTLRKSRDRQKGYVKIKDPLEDEPHTDEKGKKYTRKDLAYRHFGKTRFRSLVTGDYVAARPQSQDLWILARVVKDWEQSDAPSGAELLSLSVSKRDVFFQTKVALQDVEEYDPSDHTKVKAIARQFVLPLPRSHQEGNQWCFRCKKGMRVYAMYPKTTSLYPATVVDNTTYCRGDDNIVVVEFDGDEDEQMKIPQRHIPARFVSLIPPEFPTAKVAKQRRQKKSNIMGQTSSTAGQAVSLANPNVNQNDAELFSVLENFPTGDLVDLPDFDGSFDWT